MPPAGASATSRCHRSEYSAALAAQGVPDAVIDLLGYLFTEVLDGRNAQLTDGVLPRTGPRAAGLPGLRPHGGRFGRLAAVRRWPGGDAPMSPLLIILTIVAALGCAVVAGVFVAFSTLVMKALGPAAGAAGRSWPCRPSTGRHSTPVFMVLFLGTTPAVPGCSRCGRCCSGATGLRAWLLAGGVLYLVGSFGLTAGYHVPRNNALDAVDPSPGGRGRAVDRLPAGLDPVEPCARVRITRGGHTVHGGTCPGVNAETAAGRERTN